MTMKHLKASLTVIVAVSFSSWCWTLMIVLLSFAVISVTDLWTSWKIQMSLSGGRCIVPFIYACCNANYTIETQEFIPYSCPDCQGRLCDSSLVGTMRVTVFCRCRNRYRSSFMPWCRQIWTPSDSQACLAQDNFRSRKAKLFRSWNHWV